MRPTDALKSNFIVTTTLHVSGSLSAHHQGFLAIHQHWYIFAYLLTICHREQDGNECHPAPGSKQSSNLQKCTNANVQIRTPDDGQKDCPKHVEA